jgi:hypothetical protein
MPVRRSKDDNYPPAIPRVGILMKIQSLPCEGSEILYLPRILDCFNARLYSIK